MSPKLGAMTARKPACCKAQGACSRDEPDPKLRPETRMLAPWYRSEEHTSELQSPDHLVCRLLLEKKKKTTEDARTNIWHRYPRTYTSFTTSLCDHDDL